MLSENRGKSPLSIDAMSFAKTAAVQHESIETGYRDGRYLFVATLLTGHRKLLKDPVGCDELLKIDFIADLPASQKPSAEETSRLPVYMMTTADTGPKRTAVSKYVRIVDFLHREGVSIKDVPDLVRNEGGIEAFATKIRSAEKFDVAEYHDSSEADSEGSVQENGEDEAGDPAKAMTSDISEVLFHKGTDISVRFKKAVQGAHTRSNSTRRKILALMQKNRSSAGRRCTHSGQTNGATKIKVAVIEESPGVVPARDRSFIHRRTFLDRAARSRRRLMAEHQAFGLPLALNALETTSAA